MLDLICVDVDGTLIGASGEPTEAVWSQIARATASGQHVALATGRGAIGQTVGLADRVSPTGWHIFHNGAALAQPSTNKSVSVPLSDSVVARASEVADRHDWVIEYYSVADYTVEKTNELATGHAAIIGVAPISRACSSLDGPIVRIQFVVPSESVAAVTKAMSGVSAAVVAATSPMMPGAAFVSVTEASVSKFGALKTLAGQLELPLASTMMVGDGYNDLDAIVGAGCGVAMGDAPAEVKSAAEYVVAGVEDDGLVEALKLAAVLSPNRRPNQQETARNQI